MGDPARRAGTDILVFIAIQQKNPYVLAQVVHALDGFCRAFRGVERRQQHAGQDRDDRDHHEELDQRKTARFTLQV